MKADHITDREQLLLRQIRHMKCLFCFRILSVKRGIIQLTAKATESLCCCFGDIPKADQTYLTVRHLLQPFYHHGFLHLHLFPDPFSPVSLCYLPKEAQDQQNGLFCNCPGIGALAVTYIYPGLSGCFHVKAVKSDSF